LSWRSSRGAGRAADGDAERGTRLCQRHRPRREQLILTLALAITVAVAIKVVGVLLIAAMLIIPAAAARNLARTPESMAVFAALIGAGSAVAGLRGAFWLDTPAGPSIVCVAAILFACLSLLRARPANRS
jgi:zinc transport system permease protein